MFKANKISDRQFVSSAAAVLLLVFTFALIGFVALSVLTGNNFGFNEQSATERASPAPVVIPEGSAGTPIPSELVTYKNSALGFTFKYPRLWQKNEQGLRILLSPSIEGLTSETPQRAVIWFGIPADSISEPAELMTRVQANMLPNHSQEKKINNDTLIAGGQSWLSTRFSFVDASDTPMTAQIATTSKNEVGYFAVVVAPAEQWPSMEAAFQSIFNSFEFTTEAVLRPTDATPPPTPTPTPTPVIYIVQSGDTLLQIALQYGVDVEALAARNGIEDPRNLRTGAKLIIPFNRR